MTRDEFREGSLGVRTYKIFFLGILIFKAKFTSTNNQAVRLLTPISESNKVVVTGFKTVDNETENKSKKNKQKS